MAGKKGVLIVNLGTPDKPQRGAVYRYLKQFLLDRRVIDYPWILRNLLVRGIIAPFRSGSSAKLYQRLWTPEGSPLKIFGYSVAEGVQKELGEDYHVELGMRYQSPSIESAINKLLESRVSSITVFPMFPQYASATTGSVPPPPPALEADIIDVTPDPRLTAVSRIEVTFNRAVTNVSLGDFTLLRDGTEISLLDGDVGSTVALVTEDRITWTIGDLDPLTATPGQYELILTAEGSFIADDSGELLTTNAVDRWTVQEPPPPAAFSFSLIKSQ